ncbi:MAG: DsbA family protein [Pseudohongiellaceae bacterium]
MNKREQQRIIKEEKQRAARQREKISATVRKTVFFAVIPLLVVFTAYVLLNQGTTYSTTEIAENDHVREPGAKPVSIVVYADFQCPACATENQTILQAWPSIRDSAQLVFRHFPVTNTHRHAWTASLYAEAAGKQNRFWEMHDYLFATQPDWSNLSEVENEFDAYALELNLDIEQLHLDIASEEVVMKVRNDLRGGTASGVRGTPAVFVNGRQLNNPSRTRIIEAVNDEVNSG